VKAVRENEALRDGPLTRNGVRVPVGEPPRLVSGPDLPLAGHAQCGVVVETQLQPPGVDCGALHGTYMIASSGGTTGCGSPPSNLYLGLPRVRLTGRRAGPERPEADRLPGTDLENGVVDIGHDPRPVERAHPDVNTLLRLLTGVTYGLRSTDNLIALCLLDQGGHCAAVPLPLPDPQM